jgi:hypothetical protein
MRLAVPVVFDLLIDDLGQRSGGSYFLRPPTANPNAEAR